MTRGDKLVFLEHRENKPYLPWLPIGDLLEFIKYGSEHGEWWASDLDGKVFICLEGEAIPLYEFLNRKIV
jgi:hypothetical protein